MDSSVLKELKFLIFLSLSGKVFHNWLVSYDWLATLTSSTMKNDDGQIHEDTSRWPRVTTTTTSSYG